MTWFLSDPLTRRAWAIPVPAPDVFGTRRLRRAVAGRGVLITGASSGIGRAAALKIGAAGGRPLLVARGEEALEEVAEEIRAAGGDALTATADLSSPKSVDALLERLAGEQVDILVNNAGHSIRRAVKRSTSRAHDYERTMRLNYHGALRLILGLLDGMRERGDGQIINISTMGVQVGAPRFSAYVASKAALDAFTRVIAAELLGSGIDFTTIHMPLVRTPMIAPSGVYDAMPALTPDDAADWICEAIRSRPRSIDIPLGPLAELSNLVAPGLHERALHRFVYRSAGDSAAARGDE